MVQHKPDNDDDIGNPLRRSLQHQQSSDADSSDDDAPVVISSKGAKKLEKQRAREIQETRAATKKKARAASEKQKLKTTPPKSADDAAEASVISSGIAGGVQAVRQVPSASKSKKLDPTLFAQADQAFQAAKEAEADRRLARREQQETSQRIGSSSTSSVAYSATVKGKKRRLDDLEYVESALQQQADALLKRSLNASTTVEQIASNSMSMVASTSTAIPRPPTIDVSSALPARKTQSFLKDRLFKRRRVPPSDTAQKSAKKDKDDKPFLLFDPLLDKQPVKRKHTRSEKKENRDAKMRGRRSATAAFTRANRRSVGSGFGFKVL